MLVDFVTFYCGYMPPSNGNFCQDFDVIKVMILMMLKIHNHSALNSIRAESPLEHLCKLFAGTLLTLVNTFASCLRIPHLSEHLCILAPGCSLLY